MAFPDDVLTLSDGEVTLRAHRLSDVDVEFVTTSAEEGLIFAIEVEHSDGVRRFSGACGLRPMGEGVAEVAFGDRGVDTRAVKLLLDWGFAQGGVEVVVWYANVGNWGSRRVAWANGFTFTGTVDKLLVQRGTRVDAWFGSLRKDDSRDPKHPWHIPPVLESDRLRLRPLRETDADRMDGMFTDERTRTFMGRYRAAEQRDGASKILQLLDRDARGERFNWCVADRETDQLIGQIQLHNLGGLDPTTAEFGYSVHPESRGRGVLTEALDLVVEWAFRPVADGGAGFRRLSLNTAASNAASRHAAEKAGFTHVATEPASFPSGESDFDDSVTYHQLNPHWTP
jgi:[ribosomal protein S5]-alanine N-acetyltransferase